MSKASRRASRTGTSTGPTRPARDGGGDRPVATSPGGASGHGAAGTRAGRRDRPRTYARRSWFERNRSSVVIAGGLAALVLLVGFVFIGATGKTYACTTQTVPVSPAPAVPGQTPRLGQAQDDQGRQHLAAGAENQRYIFCPPASGPHYNVAGLGPIQPRVYGPDDGAQPQGWVHNLEHGALVVLYSCANGCPDETTMTRLQDFYDTFPDSPICHLQRGQIGPVIARFDDMKTPFAALVWDRVLFQQTLDTDQILAFFNTEAERNNPEPQPQCPGPSAAPSPSSEPSLSGSPGASGSGPASPAPAGSAAASPSPS